MDLLKFVALDGEDLDVVSAHLQDAVVRVPEVLWRAQERRLVIALNRFDWEGALSGKPVYRRRRAATCVSGINECMNKVGGACLMMCDYQPPKMSKMKVKKKKAT
jgi:hypothetical protein